MSSRKFKIWRFSWMRPRVAEKVVAGHMWPAGPYLPTPTLVWWIQSIFLFVFRYVIKRFGKIELNWASFTMESSNRLASGVLGLDRKWRVESWERSWQFVVVRPRYFHKYFAPDFQRAISLKLSKISVCSEKCAQKSNHTPMPVNIIRA